MCSWSASAESVRLCGETAPLFPLTIYGASAFCLLPVLWRRRFLVSHRSALTVPSVSRRSRSRPHPKNENGKYQYSSTGISRATAPSWSLPHSPILCLPQVQRETLPSARLGDGNEKGAKQSAECRLQGGIITQTLLSSPIIFITAGGEACGLFTSY